MNEQRLTTQRFNCWIAAVLLLLALGASHGWAQEPEQEPPVPIDGGPPPGDSSTRNANAVRLPLRGVVRNSLGGEGVAHALVQIEGDARSGVLTAGDGSFELPAVPAGPQTLTVTKPGYQDRPFGGEAVELLQGSVGRESVHASGNHSVVVAAGMQELSFVLAPAAAIEGSILFATGEPAPGVRVHLARRTVESGHLVWQMCGETRTHAAGNFRFGGLIPGEYAVFTTPFLDSEAPSFNEGEEQEAATPEGLREAVGYAAVYYPDAREPGSLTPIQLRAGQTQPVSLTLTEERFHRVAIPVANRSGITMVNSSVQDAGGRSLEYRTTYEAATNSVVALLPDGSYQLLLATAPQLDGIDGSPRAHRSPLLGMVEVNVAGKPLTMPRVALVPQQSPSIEVNIQGGATHDDRQHGMAVLANSAAGWIDDGVVSAYASGPWNGPLKTTYTVPGSYWLHPQLSDKAVCEDSLAAAGAQMAREPVHVAVGGATPPLTLTLRHDCAKLTLLLPPQVMGFVAGEEPYYTVYAIPDFDFTHDLQETTLRPTSGQSVTLEGLTPGRYRIFTFAGPHPLAYHDGATLAKLPSQQVTLLPGASAELTLEVAGR